MEEQKGIKEITEALTGVKTLAVFGAGIAADGKVDMNDVKHVIELAKHSKELTDAVEGLADVKLEAKDLTVEEAQAICAQVFEMLAAVKAAKVA